MNAEDSCPSGSVGPRSRRSFHSFFLSSAGLLLAYVLSIGPLWKLSDKTNNFGQQGNPAGIVYFPIVACMIIYEDSPPGRFFNWYVFDVWKCQRVSLKHTSY